MDIDCRLVTYGTLSPGRPNHGQLAMLGGEWKVGAVRGRLVEHGWGATLGYPALVLSSDADAGVIAVDLLECRDLPQHWARLDAFEGAEYRRVPVWVELDGTVVEAWTYVAAA
ncbi:MAG: gamma-glutamylcyclotransferase [Sphingomonadales bacterium]|nr:gamma-glutamylcyclotransferase [Sphingomonadales bacterium]